MIYAQINSGNKLHLVCEPGEQWKDWPIVRKGQVGAPICGQRIKGSYRMTINLPMGHACKRCSKIYRNPQ